MKSVIAHPHIDEDGTWWNIGMGTKDNKPCYSFIRCRGGDKGKILYYLNYMVFDLIK